VRAEADADGHVGAGVFKDEVPADDPCDEFAEGSVGVGIRRARDGDHGGELGIAKASERADDRNQNERERDGRAGAGTAAERGVVNDVFGQRRVDDAGDRGFAAGDCCADDGEDAGADDCADAESGE